MGLSLTPRYIGPSPKKLIAGLAIAFGLVAGAYELGKHASTPPAPQAQSVEKPSAFGK
jgi:hypothetical protein